MGNNKEKNKMMWLVIVIIITVVVVVVGMRYNVNRELQLKEETENLEFKSEIEETVEEDLEEEFVPEELGENDELSKTLSSKVCVPSYTLENMLNEVTLTADNIDNELILEIAWGRLATLGELETEVKENAPNTIYSVTREKMEETIRGIFGDNVEYVDNSFDALDDETFSGYENYASDVIYDEDLEIYSVSSIPGGGAATPHIYQEFESLKIDESNVAKLYVKVGYINPVIGVNNDGVPLETYEVYKSYVNNEFDQLVYETDAIHYYQVEDAENILSPEESKLGANGLLDTYVYTFNFDEETEEYYLVKFDIEIQ